MEDKVLHCGAWKENRLLCTRTQEVLMLDRDLTHEECAPGASHEPESHFDAVEPDLKKELAFVEAVRQAPESVSHPFAKGPVTAFM